MSNSDLVLSTKRAVLSSGGVRYNSLYYNQVNASVSLLECTFGYQYMTNLSTTGFGTSSQFNVPINAFISDIILHFRLPNVQVGESLSPGWGFRMIRSLEVAYGATNTTNLVLQGDGILQTLLAQCADAEKRSEIMRLSGQGHIGPIIPVLDEDTPTIDAYVVLPLALFSTMCMKQQVPFDTSLLANGISVVVNLESNPKAIYGGNVVHPTSFQFINVLMRQGKLSDQAASIRGAMVSRPDLKYSAPLIHSQRWESPSFIGQRRSQGSVTVEMTTYLNADLVGECFWVIRDDFKIPPGSFAPNPYITDEIEDILVEFAGSTLFNYPGKSYKLANMAIGGQSASFFNNQIMSGDSPLNFAAFPRDCYMVFLDYAQERAACVGSGNLQNTWRIPQQTIRVTFSTSKGAPYTYKLYTTRFYNGSCEIENGTSAIFID